MPADELIDLSDCDRQPIHQLGAIQPFGFLLAITPDWRIALASENVIAFLGVAADEIIGLPLQALVAQHAFQAFCQSAARLRETATVERLLGLQVLSTLSGVSTAPCICRAATSSLKWSRVMKNVRSKGRP